MPVVTYYMSVTSPWTYLGSARFADMARKHGYTVDIKPARFGEVFAKTGGLPLPKRSPERRAYRLMDMKRWRDHLKIPVNLEPKHFPTDDGPASRLVIAAKLAGKDAHALATEIGKALWEKEQNITEIPVLEACARNVGLDAAAILKAAPPETELAALHDTFTAEAISRGVFGAPSYVLESGEIFWGQDRLDFLDRALAKV
jgi:2-hydroxychromene-2-carboxylate isomerase